MKKILQIFLLITASPMVIAQTNAFQGYCEAGNTPVITQGLKSTNAVQGSYPQCIVTVYLTGTLTRANIFSNGTGTVLTNPFTARTDSSWLFWAADGQGYDVVLSGGMPQPFPYPRTIVDLIHNTGGSGSGTVDPSAVPFPKTYYPAAGSTVAPNPVNTVNALGDEVTKSTNAQQYTGIGANTNLNTTYSNATTNNTVQGALETPVGYAGTDTLTLRRVSQAYATLVVGNGVSGPVGTVIAANFGALGDGYNCASLPTPVINTFTSGTPVTLAPNCSNGQIISWTITNPGSGYATNFFQMTATLPFPTFNPTFSNLNQTFGSTTYVPEVRVDDFGCKHNETPGVATGNDDYNCIAAALGEVNRIQAAYPGTYVKLAFTGGGAYSVRTYPNKFRTPTDDGSIASGHICNGSPCVNLPPLNTTTNINCAFTPPTNVIIEGNNATISGRTGEFLSLGGKTSIFCGDIGNENINDLVIGGSNFSIVANHMFNVKMKHVTMSFNDIPMIIGITDRISTFDEMTFTTYAPPVFGGWYWCRGPASNNGGVCAESGGYADSLRIGTWIYNQLGQYDETSNMVPHYPNACTGVTPGGTQNYEHSIDEWFDSYFYKSCVSGTPATNSSIPGLTFQAFLPGAPSGNFANANSATLALDNTDPSSDVLAFSGNAVVIYSKDANGNQRTLRQIADAINQPSMTGSFAGIPGAVRVNITGDPTSTLSASTSPVNFSGGVASSRLADGQVQQEFRGVTGMGIVVQEMWGRPSGGVSIDNIVVEGGWRYPVFFNGTFSGSHITVNASGEGIWGCNANSSNPMGSATCIDNYNFFTPNTHTPTEAADNSAACYLLHDFSGEASGCSTSKFGRLGTLAANTSATNTGPNDASSQENHVICGMYPNNGVNTFVDGCSFDLAIMDHVPGGNTNYGRISIGAIGESPDSGVESQNVTIYPNNGFNLSNPNPGIQAGSFINYVITPKQYTHSDPHDYHFGYTSDPFSGYGYYQPQSKLIFNNTKKKYRVQTAATTTASPTPTWETLQSTPDSTPNGCATFTSNVLGSTGVACASGGGTPGGANGDVQFNSAGTFGADTGSFTYNTTSHSLTLAGVLQMNGGGIALNNIGVFPATPATSSANVNSPSFITAANGWNGTNSFNDQWFWQTILASGTNPPSTFTLFNNGSGTNPRVSIQYPILTALTAGQVVTVGTSGVLQNGGVLGTAAFQNIGTSGATVPLLNGTNTWASPQNFQGKTYTWGKQDIISAQISNFYIAGNHTNPDASILFNSGDTTNNNGGIQIYSNNVTHTSPVPSTGFVTLYDGNFDYGVNGTTSGATSTTITAGYHTSVGGATTQDVRHIFTGGTNGSAGLGTENVVASHFQWAGSDICTAANGLCASGSFAPLNNPTGGQNNYAPLANPSISGTLTTTQSITAFGSTVPSGSIASSIAIQENSNIGYLTSYGPNSTTVGGLILRGVDSTNSTPKNYVTFSATDASAAFGGPVNGPSTPGIFLSNSASASQAKIISGQATMASGVVSVTFSSGFSSGTGVACFPSLISAGTSSESVFISSATATGVTVRSSVDVSTSSVFFLCTGPA